MVHDRLASPRDEILEFSERAAESGRIAQTVEYAIQSSARGVIATKRRKLRFAIVVDPRFPTPFHLELMHLAAQLIAIRLGQILAQQRIRFAQQIAPDLIVEIPIDLR